MLESSGFLDRDVKPERFQLPDVPTRGPLRMSTGEVVGPQFLVGHAVAHHVVRNFENLMTDRHHGLLVPTLPLHSVIARL